MVEFRWSKRSDERWRRRIVGVSGSMEKSKVVVARKQWSGGPLLACQIYEVHK